MDVAGHFAHSDRSEVHTLGPKLLRVSLTLLDLVLVVQSLAYRVMHIVAFGVKIQRGEHELIDLCLDEIILIRVRSLSSSQPKLWGEIILPTESFSPVRFSRAIYLTSMFGVCDSICPEGRRSIGGAKCGGYPEFLVLLILPTTTLVSVSSS